MFFAGRGVGIEVGDGEGGDDVFEGVGLIELDPLGVGGGSGHLTGI
jgi:hypothetical protein